MPHDSVRVHAALFFVKSALSQIVITILPIVVFIVVCFSAGKAGYVRKNRDGGRIK